MKTIIVKGIITARKAHIQSSDSGKRIVIDSANNKMTFYSDTAGQYLVIDDTINTGRGAGMGIYKSGVSWSTLVAGSLIVESAGATKFFNIDVETTNLQVNMGGLPSTNDINTSGGKYLGVIPSTGRIYYIA